MQVEAWELESSPWFYKEVLISAIPGCEKLHTLLVLGPLGLDIDLLATLPCLECLALNYCGADSLQGLRNLGKLQRLRSDLALAWKLMCTHRHDPHLPSEHSCTRQHGICCN